MSAKKIPGVVDVTYSKNDSILTVRMEDKSNIDIDSAKKITELASELSQGKLHANLVDIRKMTFMSGEARKHFGEQNKNTVCAVAIVSNLRLHKPLINLYMKISRPKLPTKIFNEEDEAIKWLKETLVNSEKLNN